ncbi:MAG TPA: glycosyltransferase family 4 protein [Anaerolineae bacterium]|nr:glycosyltransferase family 4 protein [Anaerolineae bacterium]
MTGKRIKKILVFIHEYPPVGGGGGRISQNLCRGLVKSGYQIQVVTARFGESPAIENCDGVIIHRLWSNRKVQYRADFSAMIFYVLASFFKGIKLIREWKPDILHAHFAVPAGATTWALSKFTHLPYIITAHGGDVPGAAPEKTDRWFRFVMPFTYGIWKNAVKVVAVSDQTKQLAYQYYDVDMNVIGNGIDLDRLTPGKFEPNKKPHIIFAGRFSPEKNPLAIIHTLAKLEDLDWDCTLLGDGLLFQDAKRIINQHNLGRRIKLTGWISEDEVTEWFKKSDILFMPSLTEGLPLTGLKALATGLAVVLSNVGGCSNLVKENVNGFLVEPGDIDGYSKALRKLLIDPHRLLKFRKNSYKFSKSFTIKAVVESYTKLLNEISKN